MGPYIKKSFSLWLALLIALTAAPGCGANAAKETDSAGSGGLQANGSLFKVRAVSYSNNLTAYVNLLGIQKGIYAKHGLDVEITVFAAGINSLDALQLDQLDIGSAADFAFLNRVASSEESVLRIVASNGVIAPDSTVLVANSKDIDSIADLNGKKALVGIGTVGEFCWFEAIKKSGLKQSDIELVPSEGGASDIALLSNNSVSAAWGTTKTLQLLKDAGVEEAHAIADLSILDSPTVSIVVSTDKFINEHTKEMAAYLLAYAEILDLFEADLDGTAEEVHRLDPVIPVDEVKLAYNTSGLNFDFRAENLKAMQAIVDWGLNESKVFKRDYNVEDYLNLRALKEAYPDRGNYK
ncbi:MAG: ABC transporter substrate-binding protein [Clostridiales bacterium]|jgi:NitT/TauT family transport system substrate-binding protein|nr:ABC transporter substrate-binding protein [Clostridiales bacterium]